MRKWLDGAVLMDGLTMWWNVFDAGPNLGHSIGQCRIIWRRGLFLVVESVRTGSGVQLLCHLDRDQGVKAGRRPPHWVKRVHQV